MKRRIVSALGIAALLAAGIVGAFDYSVIPTLGRGQPMDEVEFDRAQRPSQAELAIGSGLEIISGNDRAMAGFKTRAGGTEVSV